MVDKSRRNFLRTLVEVPAAAALTAAIGQMQIPATVPAEQEILQYKYVGLMNGAKEVSAGGYERQHVRFRVGDDGNLANDEHVQFPVAGESWGTVTHIAIFHPDGALTHLAPVSSNKTVLRGDTAAVMAGEVEILFLEAGPWS